MANEKKFNSNNPGVENTDIEDGTDVEQQRGGQRSQQGGAGGAVRENENQTSRQGQGDQSRTGGSGGGSNKGYTPNQERR